MQKLEIFKCTRCNVEIDEEELSVLEDEMKMCFECIQISKEEDNYCTCTHGCERCLAVEPRYFYA